MSILILELTGWLCMQKNKTVTYFDSFWVQHIPKEINKKFIDNKNIIADMLRIQAVTLQCVVIFVLVLLIIC